MSMRKKIRDPKQFEGAQFVYSWNKREQAKADAADEEFIPRRQHNGPWVSDILDEE